MNHKFRSFAFTAAILFGSNGIFSSIVEAASFSLRCSQSINNYQPNATPGYYQRNYGLGTTDVVDADCRLVGDDYSRYRMRIVGKNGVSVRFSAGSVWIINLQLNANKTSPVGEYKGLKVYCGALAAGVSTGIYFTRGGYCTSSSLDAGAIGVGVSIGTMSIWSLEPH